MRKLLALAFMLSGLLFIVSCGEDDGTDPDNGVTISGVVETASIDNLGTYGPVTVTIEAEDGLASATVTKDNVAYADTTFSGSPASATVQFSYTATAGDEDSNLVFKFTAEDADGDVETATLVLSVGEAPEVPTTVTVSANISENTTWTTGTTYILAGRIAVLDGVTLTIEPGVVVKGQAGTQANATALLVARGGKLIADGDPDNDGAPLPIIFTSVSDEITPADIAAGNYGSPNLDPDINGDWGGVIVLGKATISASNKDTEEDLSEVQIEGIPTSDTNGLYGGNEDDDNSGVIRYVSIRHGGTNIGAGNEINGLSLGGVGSGTVIEHIEIVSNQDDGIEWFGGTVDVSNVVVWNVGDDGIDTDQSWAGTLDNFVVVSPGGSCFELDGPEGSFEASHTIQNGSIVASSDWYTSGLLIDVDDNSLVNLSNLYFTAVVEGQTIDRVSCENNTAGTNGCPYNNIELNVPSALTLDDFLVGATSGVTAAATPSAGVGADVSVFTWTWASQAGALEGL